MRRTVYVAAILAFAGPSFAAVPFQKVMIVIFENTSFDEAVNQPFFKEFASKGALLTNYHAIAHPSQPNYIALVAGTIEGVSGDQIVDLDLRHLGDLLEAKGKSWKVYAEDYPGSCFLRARSGRYVRRHVPFLSFTNVQKDPQRCARIVDASEFSADAANGTLPEFSIYIPDLNNDGHDTGVEFAGRWFEGKFRPLLDNPTFTRGLLFVATFDEDDLLGDNRIYAAVVGEGIKAGSVSNTAYTHYSLLRTVEDNFHLGTLGRGDAKAVSLAGLWGKKKKGREPLLRHAFAPIGGIPVLPR